MKKPKRADLPVLIAMCATAVSALATGALILMILF